MKKLIWFRIPIKSGFTMLLSTAFLFSAFSQSTLILQPDSALGKDAVLHGLSSEQNNNWGSITQLCASAWTFSSVPGTLRFVLIFDLSSIQPGSTVSNATLDLYAWDQTGGFGQHSDLSGSNDFITQRVISYWSENAVTWNTQPSTTATNQVISTGTSNPTQDYSINVTALVQDMVNDPANSFGFEVKLVTEVYYRRMNFCSSDHAIAAKRPKLTVNYSPSGINENIVEQVNFDVFPNPASDVLSVTKIQQGKYTLDIINALGENVYSQNISESEVKISLKDLAKGAYILKIWNKETAGVRRITIL